MKLVVETRDQRSSGSSSRKGMLQVLGIWTVCIHGEA